MGAVTCPESPVSTFSCTDPVARTGMRKACGFRVWRLGFVEGMRDSRCCGIATRSRYDIGVWALLSQCWQCGLLDIPS